MNEYTPNPLQIIRINEASKLFGMAKSSYYDRLKNGLLPSSISLGGRNVGYVLSELHTVLKAMIRGDSEEEIKALVKDLVKQRSII